MKMMRAKRSTAAILLVAGFVGCSAPMSIERVEPDEFYREQTVSTLGSDELSDATRTVLRRHALLESYADEPDASVARLLASLRDGLGGGDELFALAELSLWYAERDNVGARHLAAAVYAYAFLFGGDGPPSAFDPRTRLAADVYNRALGQALSIGSEGSFVPRAGRYQLPDGDITIGFDPDSLEWFGYRLGDFALVGEMQLHGMRNRYRRPGLGVPLAARPIPRGDVYDDADLVGPNIRVPATAILRIEDPRARLVAGEPLAGRLDIYASDDRSTVEVGGMEVPLESEPTVVLGNIFVTSRVWELETAIFLGKALDVSLNPIVLRSMHPYEPGKIPVVFVHGTTSTIMRWADTVNDLLADPQIRERFQFWFFNYDSGNPIAYSSFQLRRMLTEQVARLDPEGRDAALRRMVVIGHSQGGLLTKMTAIDSGDRFWSNISDEPFDDAELSTRTRELLRAALFVKPLPFVERVVFVSTPHQGSFLAGPQIVRRLAQRLIRMPGDVMKTSAEITGLRSRNQTMMSLQQVPTSIDNMAPGHPFIRTLASIPIDPRVKAHSIIAVKQAENIEDGDDGVVQYRSAHFGAVESELVVRDSHSNVNPYSIEEIRRILYVHAGAQ